MAENLQEDWLDARLREEAAYIDDGGFTGRVMQKLPVRSVGYSVRAVILIGLTVLASVLMFLFGGGWFVAEGVTRFALLPLPVILVCAAVASVLVMAGGVAAVVSRAGVRSR